MGGVLMKRTILLAVAIVLPALTSCGLAIQSAATAPPDASVAGGSTFGWHQEADRVTGDPRLEGNQFFENSLHEAVEWELSLRGIRYDESSPAVLVHHHLSLADHEMGAEVTDEFGNRATQLYTYEEGSVVVHLHYPDGRAVWIGSAWADIEPALSGPESMRKWVYSLVREMFASWPVPERLPMPTISAGPSVSTESLGVTAHHPSASS
jgi:hypothetical protein